MRLNSAIPFTLALVPAMLFSSHSEAKIQRSCHAAYRIEVSSAGPVGTARVEVGQFSARRGCGRTAANRCRRRARDSAQGCMAAFWKSPNKVPKECLAGAIRDFPSAWKVLGPRQAIELEAASLAEFLNGRSQQQRPIQVTVYARTSGDTGCKKTVKLGQLTVGAPTQAGGGFTLSTSNAKMSGSDAVGNYSQKYLGKSAGNQHTKRFSQTVTVRLSNGKTMTSKSYAPLDRSNENKLMAAKGEDYNGCARHAAQHMLGFLGYDYSVKDLGKYIKLYPGIYKFTKPNKATTPGDLQAGLNKLLGSKKETVRANHKVRVTNPQGGIIYPHVTSKGPVIALVDGGAHWVTAMGFWHPVLQDETHGSFYTFSNGYTEMHGWRYYNLGFSKALLSVSRVIAKSYRRGTMIRLMPK